MERLFKSSILNITPYFSRTLSPTKKRILVAPLDWGLGHATRCIPIIRKLLEAKHDVILAGEGKTLQILREEFPELSFVDLKGYRLTYSRFIPAWLKIFLQLPKIINRKNAEHAALKKIIGEQKIDIVVSDNRFGLWNKSVCTVYITHQVMIKCPRGFKWAEGLLYRIHKKQIEKFDYCWIPDFPGEQNLSGDLSHKYPLPENARFVGPLSRFSNDKTKEKDEHDVCIILSGPEPSRTKFEQIVFQQLKNATAKIIVVLARPDKLRDETIGTIRIVSHLNAAALQKIISSSKLVICRSGYSGIMDLYALKKSALLIPTAGQTEQEYLAEYLSSKKLFTATVEKDFDLRITMKNDLSAEDFFTDEENSGLLEKAIGLLKDCE